MLPELLHRRRACVEAGKVHGKQSDTQPATGTEGEIKQQETPPHPRPLEG